MPLRIRSSPWRWKATHYSAADYNMFSAAPFGTMLVYHPCIDRTLDRIRAHFCTAHIVPGQTPNFQSRIVNQLLTHYHTLPSQHEHYYSRRWLFRLHRSERRSVYLGGRHGQLHIAGLPSRAEYLWLSRQPTFLGRDHSLVQHLRRRSGYTGMAVQNLEFYDCDASRMLRRDPRICRTDLDVAESLEQCWFHHANWYVVNVHLVHEDPNDSHSTHHIRAGLLLSSNLRDAIADV